MSIYEKCLSYDFNAVMLNDTLDDQSSTYVPTTWRPVVDRASTLQNLFRVISCSQSPQVLTSCFRSLAQLANLRPGFFESTENKTNFLLNFVACMTDYLKAQNNN